MTVDRSRSPTECEFGATGFIFGTLATRLILVRLMLWSTADDLHDAGYAAALDDIDAQLVMSLEWPERDRMADLGGWIRGRRAGL